MQSSPSEWSQVDHCNEKRVLITCSNTCPTVETCHYNENRHFFEGACIVIVFPLPAYPLVPPNKLIHQLIIYFLRIHCAQLSCLRFAQVY